MKQIAVSKIPYGETFRVFGDTFVTLDKVDGGVLAIRRDIWKNAPFDKENTWTIGKCLKNCTRPLALHSKNFQINYREFNVSETWLRTGEGEMFVPTPGRVLDALAAEYNLSHSEYTLIEKFLELKPEARRAVIEYMAGIAAMFKANDSPAAPAFTSAPVEQTRASRQRRKSPEKTGQTQNFMRNLTGGLPNKGKLRKSRQPFGVAGPKRPDIIKNPPPELAGYIK